MTPDVIGWRGVIKRRYAVENDNKPSVAGSAGTETETDAGANVEADAEADAKAEADDEANTETEDQYLSARDGYSDSRSDAFPESDFSNIIQGAYPYPGANQTIVCQVVHSQGVNH